MLGRFGLKPPAGYLVGINLSTFLLYVYDKQISSTSFRRVPENILHLHALLGGSPMAFIAQRWLRHKTQKATFQLITKAIIILQVVSIALFYLIVEQVIVL